MNPRALAAMTVLTIACGANNTPPVHPANGGRVPSEPPTQLFDAHVPPDLFLDRTDPETAGLDGDAIARIVREAERTKSAALILVRSDRLVVERYFEPGGLVPIGPLT